MSRCAPRFAVHVALGFHWWLLKQPSGMSQVKHVCHELCTAVSELVNHMTFLAIASSHDYTVTQCETGSLRLLHVCRGHASDPQAASHIVLSGQPELCCHKGHMSSYASHCIASTVLGIPQHMQLAATQLILHV